MVPALGCKHLTHPSLAPLPSVPDKEAVVLHLHGPDLCRLISMIGARVRRLRRTLQQLKSPAASTNQAGATGDGSAALLPHQSEPWKAKLQPGSIVPTAYDGKQPIR